jgi:hypothetical protein
MKSAPKESKSVSETDAAEFRRMSESFAQMAEDFAQSAAQYAAVAKKYARMSVDEQEE